MYSKSSTASSNFSGQALDFFLQSESNSPLAPLIRSQCRSQKYIEQADRLFRDPCSCCVLFFVSCFFSKCLRLEVWTRVWNFLEASILHVRSKKYYGIPYFFTNNSGIPHYFITEFHIKNKLWKTNIKYYCPFIMNFHSCSEPRIVLNWGHMLCWVRYKSQINVLNFTETQKN